MSVYGTITETQKSSKFYPMNFGSNPVESPMLSALSAKKERPFFDRKIAIESAVMSYSADLFDYAKALTGNNTLSQNVIENVFLDMWHSVSDQIERSQKLKLSLFLKTREIALREIKNKDHKYSSTSKASSVSSSSNPVTSNCNQNLVQSFGRLDVLSRSVLYLSLIAGLPYWRIAVIEGLSEDAVKAIYIQAKNFLKR